MVAPRIVQCIECGGSFTARRAGQKYCCRNCRERYNRRIIERPYLVRCPVCGEQFEAMRNDQVYCSVKCKSRDVYWRKNGLPHPPPLNGKGSVEEELRYANPQTPCAACTLLEICQSRIEDWQFEPGCSPLSPMHERYVREGNRENQFDEWPLMELLEANGV